MKHTIESVMTAEVVTARPSTPFRELVDLLQCNRVSALPVVDQDGKLVGVVSEADLLIKEGYPHGGDDAGVIDALRHRRRLGKPAGIATRADLLKVYLRPDPAISWEVMHDVVHDRLGIRDGGVAVEVRHGVVNLAGQVERRSQVGELVRQVQAVDGVVSVDARLAWNVDDVTLMTAWPIA